MTHVKFEPEATFGQAFPNNTRPANWGPIKRARGAISQWLFIDESLIGKHKDYSSAAQFGPLPTEDTVFTQVVADSKHRGVFDNNGNPVPTPQQPHC
eukprot:958854-Ditylum_brightwellii.AAC.1